MRIPALVAAIGFIIGSTLDVPVVAQTAAVADSAGKIPSVEIAQQSVPPAGPEVVTSLPRCTLQVATEPSGAMLSIDGQKSGVSPLMLPDVAAGTHTIIIQKAGFYQKKAVVDVANSGKTALLFQLLAPGTLTIVSTPPGASVVIGGKERGTTPFTDSLVKPGVYRFSLQKEQYDRIEDSISVMSGSVAMFKCVLTPTGLYQTSPEQPVATGPVRKGRKSLFIIGGAFVLFLITLASIESRE